LGEQSNMALILITHDLAVVAETADRVIVMYAGEVVERGSVSDIFYRPAHPYTQGLLASVPRMDRAVDEGLHAIPGNPPNLQELPDGCRFRDRCDRAMSICKGRPPVQTREDGRASRCFLDMETGDVLESPESTNLDSGEEAAGESESDNPDAKSSDAESVQ